MSGALVLVESHIVERFSRICTAFLLARIILTFGRSCLSVFFARLGVSNFARVD